MLLNSNDFFDEMEYHCMDSAFDESHQCKYARCAADIYVTHINLWAEQCYCCRFGTASLSLV